MVLNKLNFSMVFRTLGFFINHDLVYQIVRGSANDLREFAPNSEIDTFDVYFLK